MKAFNTKIIAISNQKGGVGKTTSAVNIAAFLAITETPTLLIDMDPQGNASTGVGIEIMPKTKTIYDALINNENIKNCISKTDIKYLDIFSCGQLGTPKVVNLAKRPYKFLVPFGVC